MDRSGGASARKFIRAVQKFAAVGGQFDSSIGELVTEPWQLAEARIVDRLCQRYHCPPSQLLEEDAGWIFQCLELLHEAGDDSDGE